MKGKIYGFVGVIGSGKTHAMEMLQKSCDIGGRKLFVGDFSEGVRQFLMQIFTGQEQEIDLTSTEYAAWKHACNTVVLPFQDNEGDLSITTITNRVLMQRVGTIMKHFSGGRVWAKYTCDKVTAQYCKYYSNLDEGKDSIIAFGSLRYLEEAKELFRVADALDKEPIIIFCNYKSDSYELDDHESEQLARSFVDMSYMDGQDITAEISRMIKDI